MKHGKYGFTVVASVTDLGSWVMQTIFIRLWKKYGPDEMQTLEATTKTTCQEGQ